MIVTFFQDPSLVLQKAGGLRHESFTSDPTWIKFDQKDFAMRRVYFSKTTVSVKQPLALFFVFCAELPFFGHVKAGQSEDPHPCGNPPRLFDHSIQIWRSPISLVFAALHRKEEGAGVLSTFSRLNWAAAPAHRDVSNSRNSLGTTKETLRTVEQAWRQALKCGWRLLLKNASECQNIFKEGPTMRMTAVWV